MAAVVNLKKIKAATVLRMLSKDLNGAERSPQHDGDLPMSRRWVIFFLVESRTCLNTSFQYEVDSINEPQF